jgi:hypothetical protein
MSSTETLERVGTERGAKTVWTIDASHSGTSFTVRHMFTKVRGRFTDLSGTIETEGDSFTDGQVRVQINADSIDTNDAQRNAHLRTNDKSRLLSGLITLEACLKPPTVRARSFRSGITGGLRPFMHGLKNWSPTTLRIRHTSR